VFLRRSGSSSSESRWERRLLVERRQLEDRLSRKLPQPAKTSGIWHGCQNLGNLARLPIWLENGTAAKNPQIWQGCQSGSKMARVPKTHSFGRDRTLPQSGELTTTPSSKRPSDSLVRSGTYSSLLLPVILLPVILLLPYILSLRERERERE